MKLKDLEKRLKQEPTNLGLRVQVAGMMREAGRSLEAVEIYRSVALAYRDQGRTQQAIAVCRSILEIAPEDSACQGLLAMLQARNMPAKPVTPPPAQTPGAAETLPRPGTATMRNSSMPPAPEVPSLRAATGPPVGRSAPGTGQHRPVSTTAQQRPVSPTGQQRPVSPTGQQRPVSPTGQQRPGAPTGQQRPGAPTGQQRPVTPPAAQRPASPTAQPPQRPMSSTAQPAQRPVSPTSQPAQRPVSPTAPPQQRPAAPLSPTRAITRPVPQHDPRASEPGRRSSFEPTPLPKPLPHHMADRTSQPSRYSSDDIDDLTRVDPSPTGLAQAARRISGLISESRGSVTHDDISAELDTRQRPRIDPQELERVAAPPPTVPVPLERLDELDDMTTPPPGSFDDVGHRSSDALTPPPRGSEDPLGRPSRPSMPKIGPPRTSSRPPAIVSIPPKTSSRPPGSLTALPSAPRPTPSVPPMPAKPTRPTPSVPPPAGSPVAKLRAGNAPARPAMSRSMPRDSESELTRPHDRGAPDDDED